MIDKHGTTSFKVSSAQGHGRLHGCTSSVACAADNAQRRSITPACLPEE